MKLSGGWHGDLEAGGAAFEPVVNFRVAHLSRRVTGGDFDFGSSSELNVTTTRRTICYRNQSR
jgi:hypothetical protein